MLQKIYIIHIREQEVMLAAAAMLQKEALHVIQKELRPDLAALERQTRSRTFEETPIFTSKIRDFPTVKTSHTLQFSTNMLRLFPKKRCSGAFTMFFLVTLI